MHCFFRFEEASYTKQKNIMIIKVGTFQEEIKITLKTVLNVNSIIFLSHLCKVHSECASVVMCFNLLSSCVGPSM